MRAVGEAGKSAGAARRALARFRYQAAEALGTIFAWRRFGRAHPKGLLSERARKHLAQVRFRRLEASPSLPALTRFLARHGDHPLARRAWRFYLEMRAQRLLTSGSRKEVEAFLARHPSSRVRLPLRRRLERLSYDALHRRATALGIRRFLSRYPLSKHRRALRHRLRLRALTQAAFFGDAQALLAALGKARGDLGPRNRERASLLALGRVILEARRSGAPSGQVLARAQEALSGLQSASPGLPRPRARSSATATGGNAGSWLRRLSKQPRLWGRLLRLSDAASPYRIGLRDATLRAALHGTDPGLAVYAVWLLAQDGSRHALEVLVDAVASPSPVLSLHAALAALTWGVRGGRGRAGGAAKGGGSGVSRGKPREVAQRGLLRDRLDQATRCRPCSLPDRLKALALAAVLHDAQRARAVDRQPRWPRPWSASGALLRWTLARLHRPQGGGEAGQTGRASWGDLGAQLVTEVRAEVRRARATLPRADARGAGRKVQALAAHRSLSLLAEAIAVIRGLIAAGAGKGAGEYARLERECRGLAEVALRRAGRSPERSGSRLGRAGALVQIRRYERQRKDATKRLAELLIATRAPAQVWKAFCLASIKLPRCD